MSGYVYRGNKPYNPEDDERLSPCGTLQALRRHRRKNEYCKHCEKAHEARLERKRILQKKQDARKALKVAAGLAKPREVKTRRNLKPCGTEAAAVRHRKAGEEMDEACEKAYKAANARRTASYKQRKKLADLAKEKADRDHYYATGEPPVDYVEPEPKRKKRVAK